MIEETAKVVRMDDDWVWVETQRKSVCGQCAANKGCGTATLQKVLGRKRTLLPLKKTLPVRVDDLVVIGIEESALVKGSFAVYAVPLLALLLFGLLGEIVSAQMSLTGGDGLTIVFGMVGFLVGVVWLRLFASQARYNPQFQPRLLRLHNSIAVN
jgi:sigma-E factor negative regulatory protein RseC